MKWIACGLVLFLLAVCCSGKNVLVIDAVGSPSHQVWMHSLTRAMAIHGYNVTTITGRMIQDPPKNLTCHVYSDMYDPSLEEEDFNFLDITSMGIWEMFLFLIKFFPTLEQLAVDSNAFKTILNYPEDFRFDLIVYDYLGPSAFLAFADRFPEASLIGASAYPGIEYTDKITKAPHFPPFIPNFHMGGFEDTFGSRLKSFLIYFLDDILHQFKLYQDTEKKINKHFKLRRSLSDIYTSTKIVLANHNPVLDYVTPIMPGVIPVGGLQVEDPKPLPADLEEIFVKAEKGVILFSLGSNVKSETLGEQKLEGIIAALAEFPQYNIIWKIDLTRLPNLKMPKNVFIKNWLPQNNILADKRTKLFISHAGGLSTQEATWYGQPMLALPVMFDQFPVSVKGKKI